MIWGWFQETLPEGDIDENKNRHPIVLLSASVSSRFNFYLYSKHLP